MRFETALPCDVAAGAHARRMLDGWLRDMVSDQAAEAIRLGTTELVSNSLRHGGVSAGDEIRLSVEVDGNVVRVDVQQPTSAEAARALRPADADGDGGFGLAIVDELTDRWGVTEGQPGHDGSRFPGSWSAGISTRRTDRGA